AERLSTLPGAWSVAHYVELRGALDPTLLGKAIVMRHKELTMTTRFTAGCRAAGGSGWPSASPLCQAPGA
ncbi:hypothetical protein CQA70_29300, partial [Klebsiella pneumoniae]